MRKATIFLTMGLLLALTGCKNEIIIYAPGSATEENDTGYLKLSGLSVAEVAEEISSGTATSDTPHKNRQTASRATEAPDDYIVKIRNQKTSESFEYTYSELKGLEEGRLELLPGTYTISAESPNYAEYTATGAAAAWDTPVYAGEVTKLVQTRQQTEVDDLVCKLANIKTTVTLTQDMLNLFMSDEDADSDEERNRLSVTLSIEDASLTYDRQTAQQGKEGYFKAEAGKTVTMRIVLSGEYNLAPADQEPQYVSINWSNELTDCRSGQWRKISIGVSDADSGNVQFDITVENWVYDEPVEVDVMRTYAFDEETIPDEEVSDDNAPVVTLPDGDIDYGCDITASMYDDVLNKWASNLRFRFAPEPGHRVAEIGFSITSDNESFTAALADAGFAQGTAALLPANEQLNQYVVLTEAADGTITAAVKDEGMSALYKYPGTHTVKFTATDNLHRTSYTTTEIRVSADGAAEAGPSVKWTGKDGEKIYDFNRRYQHNEVEIVVEVATASQFSTFTVDIISEDVLPADELEDVGLNAHLDLIEPGEYRTALENFGFPTGEKITGESTVTFDITGFMDLLSLLNKEGDCDFRLTVGDASGTVIKTIQLHVTGN